MTGLSPRPSSVVTSHCSRIAPVGSGSTADTARCTPSPPSLLRSSVNGCEDGIYPTPSDSAPVVGESPTPSRAPPGGRVEAAAVLRSPRPRRGLPPLPTLRRSRGGGRQSGSRAVGRCHEARAVVGPGPPPRGCGRGPCALRPHRSSGGGAGRTTAGPAARTRAVPQESSSRSRLRAAAGPEVDRSA